MLRRTAASLRGRAYVDRVMAYPHRRRKALYAAPPMGERRSPLAHKTPDEYKDTWDQRVGREWHSKLRRRGKYKAAPFITMQDDPIRRHSTAAQATFSARDAGADSVPLWDHYQETARNYRLTNDAPLASLLSVLNEQVGKVWPAPDAAALIAKVAQRCPTVEAAAANREELTVWNTETRTVPVGFLDHVCLLAADVVRHNARTAYRQAQHERGDLRDRTMQSYYAVPYCRGAALPTTLRQARGAEDRGLYMEMRGGARFHPLYAPDSFKKRNYLPV